MADNDEYMTLEEVEAALDSEVKDAVVHEDSCNSADESECSCCCSSSEDEDVNEALNASVKVSSEDELTKVALQVLTSMFTSNQSTSLPSVLRSLTGCTDEQMNQAFTNVQFDMEDPAMREIVNKMTNVGGIEQFLKQLLPPRMVYVTIEGNIGSGKSTMIGHIRNKYPDYRIVDEPVHIWQALKDEANRSLLELFYTDKKRWSYTFQSSAFITRIMGSTQALAKAEEDLQRMRHQGKLENIVILSERSILTDRYVFATMLKEDGSLNPLEWELYTYWFDHFSKNVKLDGIVYVTTDSNVCNERIKQRNRQGEEGIPQQYLDDLTKYHEAWLSTTSLPVLRVTSDVSQLENINKFIDTLIEDQNQDFIV